MWIQADNSVDSLVLFTCPYRNTGNVCCYGVFEKGVTVSHILGGNQELQAAIGCSITLSHDKAVNTLNSVMGIINNDVSDEISTKKAQFKEKGLTLVA